MPFSFELVCPFCQKLFNHLTYNFVCRYSNMAGNEVHKGQYYSFNGLNYPPLFNFICAPIFSKSVFSFIIKLCMQMEHHRRKCSAQGPNSKFNTLWAISLCNKSLSVHCVPFYGHIQYESIVLHNLTAHRWNTWHETISDKWALPSLNKLHFSTKYIFGTGYQFWEFACAHMY